ncbi:MAG: hypothetical protein HYY17_05315 [Planctomycetes bacterium]|nr:hypothetical protein [Planctomycetota bacterium]
MNRLMIAAALLAGAGAAYAQESQDPTSLAQYQSNGTTAIGVGGVAWSTTVVLTGTVNGSVDATPPRHRLRVEVRPVADPFLGTYTHEATTLVTVGQTSTVTVSGLVAGAAYHWRAQTYKT